eukprot:CAMPEP_0172015216 /NCGR_PEP_ID=MMETSP1041-20130122/10357_1 /TAXON_ID=464988 /ORGANISM="Hemiselmis andersenii, Strain CCMP439" /LENGTH=104 /DNA_ID=CAMNT_0012670053 /DNA_START=33 /DNA_END=343 /DNA_ORIENTATION=+
MREEMEDMRSDMHAIRGDIVNLLNYLKHNHDHRPHSPGGGTWVAEMTHHQPELGGATASLYQKAPFKPPHLGERRPSPPRTRDHPEFRPAPPPGGFPREDRRPS